MMKLTGKTAAPPSTRRCNMCHKTRPLSDFYRDRSKAYGREYRCKKCSKAKSIKWQRESGYNTKREYCAKQKRQRQAKRAVRAAVLRGNLLPIKERKCKDCGEEASEYHHWSYNKKYWLCVIPLCIPCHKERHKGWLIYAPKAKMLGDMT